MPTAIFYKTSSVTSGKLKNRRISVSGDISGNARSYLDETGKTRLSGGDWFKPKKEYGDGYLGSPFEEKEDKKLPLESHIISHSEYPRGKLYLGGFLGKKMRKSKKPTSSPLIEPRRTGWIRKIGDMWTYFLTKRLRGRKPKNNTPIRHNFSVSLDPKLVKNLFSSGVAAQPFLEQVVKDTWDKYLIEQGWKGDKVGYLYGFHLDTANLHIQMMVFPWTEKGNRLRVSNRAKGRDGKIYNHLTRLSEIATECADNLSFQLIKRTYKPSMDFSIGRRLLYSSESVMNMSKEKGHAMIHLSSRLWDSYKTFNPDAKDSDRLLFNRMLLKSCNVYDTDNVSSDFVDVAISKRQGNLAPYRFSSRYWLALDWVKSSKDKEMREERIRNAYKRFWNDSLKKKTLRSSEEYRSSRSSLVNAELKNPFNISLSIFDDRNKVNLEIKDFLERLLHLGQVIIYDSRILLELSGGVQENKYKVPFLQRGILDSFDIDFPRPEFLSDLVDPIDKLSENIIESDDAISVIVDNTGNIDNESQKKPRELRG